jgi:hypothetical protein
MKKPLPENVTIRCCACKGMVTFKAPRENDRPTFFHTMPYCERFDQTNTADAVIQYFRDCVTADNARKGAS